LQVRLQSTVFAGNHQFFGLQNKINWK
jgi:hypothetical protein